MPSAGAKENCAAGQDAFKSSLYALVRNRCTKCHEGVDHGYPMGPAHSSPDPEASRAIMLKYVNFDDIPSSLLVTKGGNMHCLNSYGYDCHTTGAELRAAIETWWKTGEQLCVKPVLMTDPQRLPNPLPGRDQGFTAMHWSLEKMSGIARTAFEIEVQQLAPPGPGTTGAYLFRAPRLLTGRYAVAVKDIQIVLNGKTGQAIGAFRAIDQVVASARLPTGDQLAPHPVLSTDNQIVLQEKATGDTVAIAFGNLALAENPSCHALDKFESQVVPVMDARGCFHCHGGGPDNLPGRARDRQRLDLSGLPEKICQRALQRVDRHDPWRSPLINYPVRGSNGHPHVIHSVDEVSPAWINWITTETTPKQTDSE